MSKAIKSVEKINQQTLSDLNKEVQMASGAGAEVATFNSDAAKDLNALGKKVTKTNEQLKTFNGKKLSTTLQDIKTVDKNIKDILDAAGGLEKKEKGLKFFKMARFVTRTKEEQQMVDSILAGISKFTDNKLYKLIQKALSTNHKEDWLKLFESAKFMDFIEKNRKNENIFLLAGLIIEKCQNMIFPESVITKLNKIGRFMGYISGGIVKGALDFGIATIKSGKMFKEDGVISKFGKFGKAVIKNGFKVSKLVGRNTVMLPITAGTNVLKDLSEQKGQRNIARAVNDGIIDTVANIGPVDGTILGSAGGPLAAAAVGSFGLVSQRYQKNIQILLRNIKNSLMIHQKPLIGVL